MEGLGYTILSLLSKEKYEWEKIECPDVISKADHDKFIKAKENFKNY